MRSHAGLRLKDTLYEVIMLDGDLAIAGGVPVVQAGMVRPWPPVTDVDRAAVLKAMDADGETEVNLTLARDWAQYVGVRHCIPCNSGTAALHMAVAGVGVRPGEEVICPAFTYWATAAAVLHHNAVPVFVDIERDTYCLDPHQIESAISARTRAIMPVHIHGMPADMDAINRVAQRHGLAVIEDAAQAAGAAYRGRRTGALGTCAGFSLQATKNLTSGSQGGLFVTDDETVFLRAQLLQYLGEIVVPGREQQTQQYNAYGLGWMYRGDKLGLAFARSQMGRLDEYNAMRRSNASILDAGLRDIPGVRPAPAAPDGRTEVRYEYVVQFCPEDLGLDVPPAQFLHAMQAALKAEGVPNRRWQTMPVPSQHIFQTREGYGAGCPWTCHGSPVRYEQSYPIAEWFIARHAYITGIAPPNGRELMERYVEAFRKVLAQPADVLRAMRAQEA